MPEGGGEPYRSWAVAFVEPRYSVNVGYVARVMANFGLGRLVIVSGGGEKLSSATARRYASHGSWILEGARVVPSLRSLRRESGMLVATTARVTGARGGHIRRPVSPEELVEVAGDREDVTIVLGRDTTGLTNEEVAECDFVLHLKTWTEYPTLNVSHALAIMLYEVARIYHSGHGLYGFSRPLADEISALDSAVSRAASALGYPEGRAEKVRVLMRRLALRGERSEVRAMMGLIRGLLGRRERLNRPAGRGEAS
ncbi:MAG: RNA methyltransferase [Conexivisphaera sp.]